MSSLPTPEWHYAVIGGYLTDENHRIYGITCRHVTKASADKWVYIKTDKGDYVKYGRILKTCDLIERDMDFDIDIFEIREEFHSCCAKWNTSHKSVKIFDGKVADLYGIDICSVSGDMKHPDAVYFHGITRSNEDCCQRPDANLIVGVTDNAISSNIDKLQIQDTTIRHGMYIEDTEHDFNTRQASNLSEISNADSGISFGGQSTWSRQSDISRDSGLSDACITDERPPFDTLSTDNKECNMSTESHVTNVSGEHTAHDSFQSENAKDAIIPNEILVVSVKFVIGDITVPDKISDDTSGTDNEANDSNDENRSSNSDEDMSSVLTAGNYKGVIHGRVATKKEHQQTDIGEPHILVRSNDRTFMAGDSGTIIAIVCESTLRLVGVLTAGIQHEDLETNVCYIKCVLISSGLGELERCYGIKLHLYTDTELTTTKSVTRKEILIHAGYIIWVKSPEDIKAIEYNLLEHIHGLINLDMNDDISDLEHLRIETEFEKSLSRSVSSREDVSWGESNDKPAFICYYLCIVGVDSLYSGQYTKAELTLDKACRCLVQTPYRNRLLCKIITYTTWVMLKTDRVREMLTLLETGEPFMTKMANIKICPGRSMGYFYFDYARYYIATKQPPEALTMGKQSLKFFRQSATNAGSLSIGESLSLCLIARIYLGCGEDFETCESAVTRGDIIKADECLKEVGRGVTEAPAIVLVGYQLGRIDYYYRLGRLEQALNIAELCHRETETNNLKEEQLRSKIRIDMLKKKNEGT